MFIRSACLKTYPLHRSLLLRNSKESQNLCLPAGFSKHPVLVCEFNDCSLYILCAEKECTAWKIHLQEEVGDDGGDDNGAMMRMMMMICCHLTSLFSGYVQQQQCLARAASDSRRHPGHCGQVCQVRLQVRSFEETSFGLATTLIFLDIL